MIVMNKMIDALHKQSKTQWQLLEINESEFFLLFALDANGPLTIQEIGSKINMTSGTMTYLIDKLELKGYIKRVRCEKDRRRIYIELTQSGKVFWDEIIEAHMIHMAKMFDHVSLEEMNQVIELMKKIGKEMK
jgi:MarR family 2-MHQ and catechol resistance regulon transcriptional repressor